MDRVVKSYTAYTHTPDAAAEATDVCFVRRYPNAIYTGIAAHGFSLSGDP
jgi:hypothetical protein